MRYSNSTCKGESHNLFVYLRAVADFSKVNGRMDAGKQNAVGFHSGICANRMIYLLGEASHNDHFCISLKGTEKELFLTQTVIATKATLSAMPGRSFAPILSYCAGLSGTCLSGLLCRLILNLNKAWERNLQICK